jgi:stress response protein SCP2
LSGGLLAAVLLFAVSNAHAALFDDNEARARIAEVDRKLAQMQKELGDRVAALEATIKSQGLVDLFNQVEQIKSDIARLRGQQEVLTYELEQAQKATARSVRRSRHAFAQAGELAAGGRRSAAFESRSRGGQRAAVLAAERWRRNAADGATAE